MDLRNGTTLPMLEHQSSHYSRQFIAWMHEDTLVLEFGNILT